VRSNPNIGILITSGNSGDTILIIGKLLSEKNLVRCPRNSIKGEAYMDNSAHENSIIDVNNAYFWNAVGEISG